MLSPLVCEGGATPDESVGEPAQGGWQMNVTYSAADMLQYGELLDELVEELRARRRAGESAEDLMRSLEERGLDPHPVAEYLDEAFCLDGGASIISMSGFSLTDPVEEEPDEDELDDDIPDDPEDLRFESLPESVELAPSGPSSSNNSYVDLPGERSGRVLRGDRIWSEGAGIIEKVLGPAVDSEALTVRCGRALSPGCCR